MNITLIFPPHWVVHQPYLSLPSLTAYLRENGYNVIQRDINIESADDLFRTVVLKDAYKKLQKKLEYLKNLKNRTSGEEILLNNLSFMEDRDYAEYTRNILRMVNYSKNVMRDKDKFFDFHLYRDSINNILFAYYILGILHETNIDFMTFYREGYPGTSIEGIIKYIHDEENNYYADYFRHVTVPSLQKEPSELYGISVSSLTQMLPAMTLAGMIKKAIPQAHICMGGNIFTRIAEKLVTPCPLFDFFDSVIIYEGEVALLELVKALEHGYGFDSIPNFIYRDKHGEIIHNKNLSLPDINSLPAPDFDGLPLERYFSPFNVFPLLTGRGCYWNKCAFCRHKSIYGNTYRVRKIEKVMDDIEILRNKYGTKYITFYDEAIHPVRLKKIAAEIMERHMDIRWEATLRGEKEFDREIADLAFKAGARLLSFGLESACPRVLDLMCKGIDINVFREVLRYSAEAGIWNYAFFFTGFPTETEEEAMKTADFILRNQDFIHSVSLNVPFFAVENTDIDKNPDKYSIQELTPMDGWELAVGYNYTVTEGMSQKKAGEMALNICNKIKREHRQSSIFSSMNRVHQMLYADHFNTNNLASVVLPDSTYYCREV